MASSGAIIHGRVTKRTRNRQQLPSNVANQLKLIEYDIAEAQSRPGRARPTNELAKYEAEIKYYYLSRGYTLGRLHEAMEIIFRIGATIKQYGGYVDRADFKKKVTKEEWTKIAPYFYACNKVNQDVAVRINGLYTIEPRAVKKEVERHTSGSQKHLFMRQQQHSLDLNQSLSFGRIEAYIPSSQPRPICQKIPGRILQQLPIFRSERALLQICHDQIKQKYGDGKELSGVANSSYFKFLRALIYRLSNNLAYHMEIEVLLDKIMSFGYRASLKALLSLDILSIRIAAKNMLPVLLLRRDGDLIKHIYKVHGPGDTAALWYSMLEYIIGKISTERSSADQWDTKTLDVLKFIADGIEENKIYARTAEDGVFLLVCAIRSRVMEISTMRSLLPPRISNDQLETEHIRLYGGSILEFHQGMILRERLELGFRRNIHVVLLKAVLQNDTDAICTLLPYTSLGIPDGLVEDYQLSDNGMAANVNVWDRLGVNHFHRIVAAASESLKTSGWKRSFSNKDLLLAAYYIQDTDLREFLLKYFKHRYEDNTIRRILKEVIFNMLLEPDSIKPFLCFFNIRNLGIDEKSTAEWGGWLISNGADITGTFFCFNQETSLLHLTIKYFFVGLSFQILGLGADVNILNARGQSPLDIFIDDYELDGDEGYDDDSKKLLEYLLQSGAQINRPGLYDSNTIEPFFEELLLEADMSSLLESWSSRWESKNSTEINPFGLSRGLPEDHCRFCFDLASWFDKPPAGAERARRIEAITDHLKSEGLRCCDIWVDSDNHIKYKLPNVLRSSIDSSSIDFLHLLAIIPEPDLIRTVFSVCCEDVRLQIQQKNYEGLAPLHLAVALGNIDYVRVLLENGAESWERCLYRSWKSGSKINIIYTPLHFAIEYGHMAIARCLIEYGAFPSLEYKPFQHEDGCGGEKNITKEQSMGHSTLRTWARSRNQTVSWTEVTKRPTEVQLAVRLGRLDFLDLLLHVNINARYEARIAAEDYENKIMLDWIDEHWMGKPRHNSSETQDRIESQQQLEFFGGIPYISPEDYDMSTTG